MHTITHGSAGREDPVSIAVVIEGIVALLGLIAFVGAICGALTWATVHLVTDVLL
jgi:hypothetical protein